MVALKSKALSGLTFDIVSVGAGVVLVFIGVCVALVDGTLPVLAMLLLGLGVLLVATVCAARRQQVVFGGLQAAQTAEFRGILSRVADDIEACVEKQGHALVERCGHREVALADCQEALMTEVGKVSSELSALSTSLGTRMDRLSIAGSHQGELRSDMYSRAVKSGSLGMPPVVDGVAADFYGSSYGDSGFRRLLEERKLGREPFGRPFPLWIEGRDRSNNKIRVSSMVQRMGICVPEMYRVFEDPSLLDLRGLPSSLVVKPNRGSTSRGVFVLSGLDGRYFEFISREFVTQSSMKKLLADTLNKRTDKRVIAEEIVRDSHGSFIARDYKMLVFGNRVGLIYEIDRSTEPHSISFYDGDFNPIVDGRLCVSGQYFICRPGCTPNNAASLIDAAERICQGFEAAFVRVDMYSGVEQPVFGEVTYVPGALFFGRSIGLSPDLDEELGEMWRRAAVGAVAE